MVDDSERVVEISRERKPGRCLLIMGGDYLEEAVYII